MPSDQSIISEQGNLTYYPLRKPFERQIKMTEDQGEKLEKK